MNLVRLVHRFSHERAISLVGVLISRDAQQREVVREKLLFGEVVDGRDELAFREVPGGAEYHHRAWIGLVATPRSSRCTYEGNCARRLHDFFTAWPPNSFRSAAMTLAEKESGWRERSRASNDRVITGAGTSRSIASYTVHLP